MVATKTKTGAKALQDQAAKAVKEINRIESPIEAAHDQLAKAVETADKKSLTAYYQLGKSLNGLRPLLGKHRYKTYWQKTLAISAKLESEATDIYDFATAGIAASGKMKSLSVHVLTERSRNDAMKAIRAEKRRIDGRPLLTPGQVKAKIKRLEEELADLHASYEALTADEVKDLQTDLGFSTKQTKEFDSWLAGFERWKAKPTAHNVKASEKEGDLADNENVETHG